MRKIKSIAIVACIVVLPMLQISCQADDIEPQALPDKSRLKTPPRD